MCQEVCDGEGRQEIPRKEEETLFPICGFLEGGSSVPSPTESLLLPPWKMGDWGNCEVICSNS